MTQPNRVDEAGTDRDYVIVHDGVACAAIILFDTGSVVPIGNMRWRALVPPSDPQPGKIENIFTDPAYRRQHVATAMFRIAERESAARGWIRPQHDDETRTPEGNAWARSVGAAQARVIAIPGALASQLAMESKEDDHNLG